jgi:hypothetical protein
MAQHTLSASGIAFLVRTGHGVLLTADAMATRTALYERRAQSLDWDCVESGLNLTHIKTEDGDGYRWSTTEDRFITCLCAQCLSTDTDDEP